MSEHKICVWAQTCLGTIVSGHNRVSTIVWGQACMCTNVRVVSIENIYNFILFIYLDSLLFQSLVLLIVDYFVPIGKRVIYTKFFKVPFQIFRKHVLIKSSFLCITRIILCRIMSIYFSFAYFYFTLYLIQSTLSCVY